METTQDTHSDMYCCSPLICSKDPRDAPADLNADGYTNIEEFINKTDPTATVATTEIRNTYIDIWESAPQLRSRLKRK